MTIDLQRSELSVEAYEALHGGPVYRTDPDKCCLDRKIRVWSGWQSITTLGPPGFAVTRVHTGQHADCPLGQQIRAGQNQPVGNMDQERRVGQDRS